MSVLILEDEFVVALDVEMCLEEAGHTDMRVVSNVADALRALEARDFDLAVLDWNLGSETSEQVLARLIEMGVPACICTAYERSQLPAWVRSHPLVNKPFSDRALLAATRHAMDRAHGHTLSA